MLDAQRQFFEESVLDRWRAGSLTMADEKEAMGRTRTLIELQDVNPGDFVTFLGPDQPQDEDDDETQNS